MAAFIVLESTVATLCSYNLTEAKRHARHQQRCQVESGGPRKSSHACIAPSLTAGPQQMARAREGDMGRREG